MGAESARRSKHPARATSERYHSHQLVRGDISHRAKTYIPDARPICSPNTPSATASFVGIWLGRRGKFSDKGGMALEWRPIRSRSVEKDALIYFLIWKDDLRGVSAPHTW